MRFRIDLKIFVFLILFYLTRQIETYAILMILAILHEFGHLLIGLALGMKPEKIELRPFGFSISFKLTTEDYNEKIGRANKLEIKKIIVAMAGPLTNCFLIFITLKFNFNVFEEMMIIYANIILILYNILPIYPLDGGRILKGILHIFFGRYKSYKYINNISFFILIILTAISSIAIIYFKNIAIFFAIMYLWILFIGENKKFVARENAYKIIKKF